MNGKLLLDTNAAIAFMAGDASTVARITSSSNSVSIVASGEFYGAHNSDRIQQNVNAIENLMSSLSVLDRNSETGRILSEIKSGLRKIGKPIPDNDNWIAATAVQHSLTSLTRDVHFHYVTRLAAIQW